MLRNRPGCYSGRASTCGARGPEAGSNDFKNGRKGCYICITKLAFEIKKKAKQNRLFIVPYKVRKIRDVAARIFEEK